MQHHKHRVTSRSQKGIYNWSALDMTYIYNTNTLCYQVFCKLCLWQTYKDNKMNIKLLYLITGKAFSPNFMYSCGRVKKNQHQKVIWTVFHIPGQFTFTKDIKVKLYFISTVPILGWTIFYIILSNQEFINII